MEKQLEMYKRGFIDGMALSIKLIDEMKTTMVNEFDVSKIMEQMKDKLKGDLP